MTQEFSPITPPPDLVEQWKNLPEYTDGRRKMIMVTLSRERLLGIAAQAAQYGADQELEACCEWVNDDLAYDVADRLRAARRPKPPSLKKQALRILVENGTTLDGRIELEPEDIPIIRRALEALPE